MTEEMYQTMYTEDKSIKSLQLTPWPKPEENRINENAEKEGDLAMSVIAEIRREKAEKRKPLNTPIKKVTIYAGNRETANMLNANKEDIAGTCKILDIEILPVKGEGTRIQENSEISFLSEY
jgi:valyl-tRNA synthetase